MNESCKVLRFSNTIKIVLTPTKWMRYRSLVYAILSQTLPLIAILDWQISGSKESIAEIASLSECIFLPISLLHLYCFAFKDCSRLIYIREKRIIEKCRNGFSKVKIINFRKIMNIEMKLKNIPRAKNMNYVAISYDDGKCFEFAHGYSCEDIMRCIDRINNAKMNIF